jgi:phosphatidylserine/phosphatidylglycerophosphate/cardiolipin synthase-like enzyme
MNALRVVGCLLLVLCSLPAAARDVVPPARTGIGFPPKGGAQELILRSIRNARESICAAAYSFTSREIARALIDAHQRGVYVRAVLDDSQKSERYTGATFLANVGIPTRTSSRYGIMHNEFLVIDARQVQTGSFNYTKSAEERNAENVIVLWNQPTIVATYSQE